MPLNPDLPPLTMDLNRYRETVTVLRTTSAAANPGSIEHEISSNFKATIRSESSSHQLEDIRDRDFINYTLELGKTQQAKIDTKYIAAATIDKGTIIAWLNNEPLHSAGLTLNLIHNAMAKTLIGPEASISVTLQPFPNFDRRILSSYKAHHNDATHFAINYGFCMSIVTALYALNVIEENQSRAKLFQFMSGVDVLTYWISHFIWDFTTFVLTGLITIIILFCFQMDGYTTNDQLARIFGFILLFGCAALPLTYIVAKLFNEPAVGICFIALSNIICGPFIFYIVEYLQKPSNYIETPDSKIKYKQMVTDIEGICVYYPHFALTMALRNLNHNDLCRKYCKNVLHWVKCNYTKWQHKECCPIKPYMSLERPGIIRELTALLIIPGVLFLFLILTEYISIPRLWNIIRGIFTKLPKPQANRHCDEDVEQEKLRVAYLSKKDIVQQNQNLVLKKLTKFYGSHVAVNQISVGIKHRECFGLLGVNGAGKTTTLKMLTGEERISTGVALVKGLSVKWRMNAIYRKIGYCPQQSYGLFDNLTGRENLYMYALLRGIPQDKIASISMKLAYFTNLLNHYYKPVREYSVGNKRKLSTALALLGRPSVIYLDEPTTGIDPASRQNLWNIICKVRDAGSSIVLTSQSMEECEALCTRLALMSNGEFKYIGSMQNIKSRLTRGLILKTKMRREIDVPATDSESVLGIKKDSESDNGSDMAAITQKVLNFIRSRFPCAVLKESNQEFLIFYIPLEKKWWSKLFDIEANKDSLNIEDYSINRLTYGDIF